MNDVEEKTMDSYRSFLLLNEIASEEPLSQRELARRLGIALGLVNSYLKNLVAKGYVRITAFPRNRYGYLLTPRGIAEKSRLAYRHLSYFTNLYKSTRQDYLALFRRLSSSGISGVAFCGVDEVAEIAYLSLSETGMGLSLVMDDDHAGEDFFGSMVVSLDAGVPRAGRCIVVTSLKRGERLADVLAMRGVDRKRIFHVEGFPSAIEQRSEDR
jgi:DNA-binding MarR family transcriptional regulator